MAQVIVVYSVAEARVRRWFVTDEEKLHEDPSLLQDGEAMLVLPSGRDYDLYSINEEVRKATGQVVEVP